MYKILCLTNGLAVLTIVAALTVVGVPVGWAVAGSVSGLWGTLVVVDRVVKGNAS